MEICRLQNNSSCGRNNEDVHAGWGGGFCNSSNTESFHAYRNDIFSGAELLFYVLSSNSNPYLTKKEYSCYSLQVCVFCFVSSASFKDMEYINDD